MLQRIVWEEGPKEIPYFLCIYSLAVQGKVFSSCIWKQNLSISFLVMSFTLKSSKFKKILSVTVSSLLMFLNIICFLRWGMLAPRPIHQPRSCRTNLVGCPLLLIWYIRSSPPYCRPFLHPQPEDAPCRGDRDPLITDTDSWRALVNAVMNLRCSIKCGEFLD